MAKLGFGGWYRVQGQSSGGTPYISRGWCGWRVMACGWDLGTSGSRNMKLVSFETSTK